MLATLRYFGAIKIQEVLTKSSKIHSAHMTRNLVGRESAARVQISDPPPMRFQAAQKKPQDIGVLRLFTNLEGYKELLI